MWIWLWDHLDSKPWLISDESGHLFWLVQGICFVNHLSITVVWMKNFSSMAEKHKEGGDLLSNLTSTSFNSFISVVWLFCLRGIQCEAGHTRIPLQPKYPKVFIDRWRGAVSAYHCPYAASPPHPSISPRNTSVCQRMYSKPASAAFAVTPLMRGCTRLGPLDNHKAFIYSHRGILYQEFESTRCLWAPCWARTGVYFIESSAGSPTHCDWGTWPRDRKCPAWPPWSLIVWPDIVYLETARPVKSGTSPSYYSNQYE